MNNIIPPTPVRVPPKSLFSTLPMYTGGTTFVVAVVCAICGDFLFGFHHTLGWPVGLFGVALGTAVLLAVVRRTPVSTGTVIVSGTTLLVAAASFFLSPSWLAVFLLVFSLISLMLAGHVAKIHSAVQWFLHIAEFHIFSWIILGLDALRLPGLIAGSRRNEWLKKIAVWSIAVVLSFLFLFLFSLANPIISRFWSNLWDIIRNFRISLEFFLRLLQFLFIAGGAFMLLRYRLPNLPFNRDVKVNFPSLPTRVTHACLVVFNLVFALQTLLDICYLFGRMSLPEGMTYAQYAHRGFYPLWAAAMLAALFMMFAWTDNEASQLRTRAQKILASLWLIQNGFLLISASYRLHLYVNVYSLTRLRVAAAVGMALVFVGLASIAIRVYCRKTTNWLITTNFFSVLTVLLIILLVNVSSFIAEFNLKHCREITGEGQYLDITYLRRLGTAVAPSLIQYSRQSHYAPGLSQARTTLASIEKRLDEELEDWRGWSWERQRVRQMLSDFNRSPDSVEKLKDDDRE